MSTKTHIAKTFLLLFVTFLVQFQTVAQRDLQPPFLGRRPQSTYLTTQEIKLYEQDMLQAYQLAALPEAKGFIQFDELMKEKWASKMFARYQILKSALFAMDDSKKKNSDLAKYVVEQIESEGIKVDPFVRVLVSCQYINYHDVNTKEERDKHTLSTATYFKDLLTQNAAFDDSLKRIKKRRLDDISMLKNDFFVPSVVARLKKDYSQAPFDLKTLMDIVQQLKQALPQDATKWDEVRDYVLQRMRLSVEGVSKDPFPPTPATTEDTK